MCVFACVSVYGIPFEEKNSVSFVTTQRTASALTTFIIKFYTDLFTFAVRTGNHLS